MKTAEVLSVRIDLISKNELLVTVGRAIEENKKLELFTVNNEFVVKAQKDTEFREILNSSDINIADSTGIVWALNRQGIATPKLPGADIFEDICQLAGKKQWKVYLLGGEKGSASKTANALKLKFPNIKIAGITENIKIDPINYEPELIRAINSTDPDIIFVALGAPKQEKWIRNNKQKLKAKLFMGVGGTFDYVSGNISRAPETMRRLGLEWLYRLLQQPSRFKRIFSALVTFPYLVRKNDKNS